MSWSHLTPVLRACPVTLFPETFRNIVFLFFLMSDPGSNFSHLAIPEGIIPVASTLFWRHWSTVSPGFLFWYSVIQLSRRHLLENKIQIQGSRFPFLFNVADQSYRCAPARLSQGLVVLAHFKHPFLSSLHLPVSSVLFRFGVYLNYTVPVLKSSAFQSCCLLGSNSDVCLPMHPTQAPATPDTATPQRLFTSFSTTTLSIAYLFGWKLIKAKNKTYRSLVPLKASNENHSLSFLDRLLKHTTEK